MAHQKRALITGITGQDGSYLAEFLLKKGYQVYGLVRRTATPNTRNIDHLLANLTLVYGDLTDQASINQAIFSTLPDEVYNLAAQSFVGESWRYAEATAEQTGLGALRILEALKTFNPKVRFYQASTSEMFGNAPAPQNESTPFRPRSPYGVAKLFAHHITINYRESYGLFAVCGILFNHESPRRGFEFVTRKISSTAAKIKLGAARDLHLGNLDAKRDWGFAGDYVEAMWLMLQQDQPEDFVVGTGETHSVQEFVDLAFAAVDLNPKDHVVMDSTFIRPAEINHLVADPQKARTRLGWRPKVIFPELVKMMVDADLVLERQKLHPRGVSPGV